MSERNVVVHNGRELNAEEARRLAAIVHREKRLKGKFFRMPSNHAAFEAAHGELSRGFSVIEQREMAKATPGSPVVVDGKKVN